MVEFDIIIPARLDSKRLPGKVLRDICGKTLIEWVYKCAKNSSAISVTIATDDISISRVAESFGANVCMTSAQHQSGTDRVAEAAQLMNLEDERIVINLQADEPSMPSELIDQVANLLYRNQNASLGTACTVIESIEEYLSRDVVKVVRDQRNFALYFSRAPIPFFDRNPKEDLIKSNSLQAYRHIGLYAYRVEALNRLAAKKPIPFEELEQLEQLRALWYGESIVVCDADTVPGTGVDTLSDLELVIQTFSSKT